MRFMAALAFFVISISPALSQQIGGGGGGATSSSVAASGAPTGYLNVMSSTYGAKGDTLSYSDGTITSGTNAFSSASATFTAADVGKQIVVDYAGAAGAPLVTTITGFTGAHNVTLGANASTSVPYIFAFSTPPTTSQSGGGSYAPNDTVTFTGGTATTNTVTTVKYTQTVAAVQNANGSGGATNTGATSGSCQVQGTTGAGPQKFTVNVTLTSGAISAIGTFVNQGSYTTNPTSLAAEPVTPVNGCTGLSGATLALTMGVLVAQPSTAGVYSVIPSSPVAQGSTSGSGTGATFSPQWVTAGAFSYGTDDTSALTAAVNAANVANATSLTCLFFPAGTYMVTSPLPTWTTPGCLVGAGKWKTFIFAHPSLNGDLLSWSEAWAKSSFSVNGSISALTTQASGPQLREMTILADRTSTNTQNAIVLYDRNDYVDFRDLYISNFTGYCLASGLTKNTALAFVRESDFNNINMFGCGNSTHPAMLFDSAGTGDASNEVRMNSVEIFAYYGHGAVFRSSSSSGVRDFYISKLRIEGIQFDPVTIAADNLVIGDSTATSKINNWSCFDCRMLSVYPGQSAIRLDANGTTNAPYYIRYLGSISGGAPQGKGLTVNFGRDSEFFFHEMNTEDINVTLGASAGSNINLNAPGGAQISYTYSVSGGSLVSFPIASGNPASQTQRVTLGVADNTLNGGNARGNGAVDLQVNRTLPFDVASGANSVIAGGINNQATSNGSQVTGGQAVSVNGQFSRGGGIRIADRARYGGDCYGSGFLAVAGDAQQCTYTLRCTVATSGGTCVMTADQTAAGSANCVNIPNNTIYTVDIALSALDHTTPANNWSWTLQNGLLIRGANAASTAFSAGSNVTLSNGTVTAIAATPTADTTNGCLTLTFTHPTGTTNTWNAVARVHTVEVQ
jgi:hypothetical protein